VAEPTRQVHCGRGRGRTAAADRHYLDLLPAYLTDDYCRIRPGEVAAALKSVTVLTPDGSPRS
jgi:hypothetical protein